MKKLLFIVNLLVLTAVYSQTQIANNTTSKIGFLEFQNQVIKYGDIKQNANGTRSFVFKNTGNAPVVISKVKTSCGCTVATKPRQPIMPNETAEISIEYATKRIGRFSKSVSVFSNAENKMVNLRITGNVIAN